MCAHPFEALMISKPVGEMPLTLSRSEGYNRCLQVPCHVMDVECVCRRGHMKVEYLGGYLRKHGILLVNGARFC